MQILTWKTFQKMVQELGCKIEVEWFDDRGNYYVVWQGIRCTRGHHCKAKAVEEFVDNYSWMI